MSIFPSILGIDNFARVSIWQPLRYMKWAVNWMIGRASWLLLRTQLAQIINPDWAWSMEQEENNLSEDEEGENPGKCAHSIYSVKKNPITITLIFSCIVSIFISRSNG